MTKGYKAFSVSLSIVGGLAMLLSFQNCSPNAQSADSNSSTPQQQNASVSQFLKASAEAASEVEAGVLAPSAANAASMMLFKNTENLKLGFWQISEAGIVRQRTFGNIALGEYSARAIYDRYIQNFEGHVNEDENVKVIVFQNNKNLRQVIFPYWVLDSSANKVGSWGYLDFSDTMIDGFERTLVAVVSKPRAENAFFYFREKKSGDIGLWTVSNLTSLKQKPLRVATKLVDASTLKPLRFDANFRFLGAVIHQDVPRLFLHNEKSSAIHFVDVLEISNGLVRASEGRLESVLDPNLYFIEGVYQTASNAAVILPLRNRQYGHVDSWVLSGNSLAAKSGPRFAASVPFFYKVDSSGESSALGYREDSKDLLGTKIDDGGLDGEKRRIDDDGLDGEKRRIDDGGLDGEKRRIDDGGLDGEKRRIDDGGLSGK